MQSPSGEALPLYGEWALLHALQGDDPTSHVVLRLLQETFPSHAGGITTGITLLSCLYREGVHRLERGIHIHALKQGMLTALGHLHEELRRATASFSTHEAATCLFPEYPTSWRQQAILLAHQHKLNSGYCSPYFVTHPHTMTVELIHPVVLTNIEPLETAQDAAHLLSLIDPVRPLLIITHHLGQGALKTLIINHLRKIVTLCVIQGSTEDIPLGEEVQRAYVKRETSWLCYNDEMLAQDPPDMIRAAETVRVAQRGGILTKDSLEKALHTLDTGDILRVACQPLMFFQPQPAEWVHRALDQAVSLTPILLNLHI